MRCSVGVARVRSIRILLLYSAPPPDRPRLVVIRIAPFAASMPYSADASTPLRLVTDSMSLGLTSAARLVKSMPRLLSAVVECKADPLDLVSIPPRRSSGLAALSTRARGQQLE